MSKDSMDVVQVEDISKSFGKLKVLKNISFTELLINFAVANFGQKKRTINCYKQKTICRKRDFLSHY